MTRYLSILTYISVIAWLSIPYLQAQSLTCEPDIEYQGEVFLNYGSVSNAVNSDNRTAFSLGQPVVGEAVSADDRSAYGFYSRFLLPPSELILTASQGDFPDEVQLSWVVDPLSPVASNGFKVFRDGIWLADLGKDIRQYIHSNAQSGQFYEYEVIGYNSFGAGYARSVVGFVNPNGYVSGEVVTTSGNPVPGVVVQLTPKTGTSLYFNGANAQLCIDHNDAYTSDVFTASVYVKMTEDNMDKMIIDRGSALYKNWWIKAIKRDGKKGYVAYVGDGTEADSLVHLLVPESPTDVTYEDDWHQVTLTYNGSSMTLMVDGAFSGTRPATLDTVSTSMNVGSSISGTDFYKGWIDDIRIYDRVLTQTEVMQSMNRTVAASERGLVAYWKMDEGVGEKAFDISLTDVDAKIFGATYHNSTPEVYNAGLTDGSGLYNIDGINYSAVQSFQVQPMKDFYFNSALEFSAAEGSCANLTAYDIPDSSTIELTFHPFDLKSTQSILHKDGQLELWTSNGFLFLDINGTMTNLGAIEAKYYRISMTLDNGTGQAVIYLNGEYQTDISFTPVSDWSGSPWLLGADICAGSSQYYTGLIDEFVVFNGLLPQNYIQLSDGDGTPATGYRDTIYNTRQLNGAIVNDTSIRDFSIFSYFDLSEGIGAEIVDYAAVNDTTLNGPRTGSISRASWSANVRNKATEAHEFEPNIRVAIINKSNTAVGNVDFTDVSTVNVSGTVRYDNSFCFAEQVEILVNGQSHVPPIYTNEDGEWNADFEPGASIILAPKYQDHSFTPSLMEFRKLQVPKAGIVFLDNTKRTISGQIAGGLCKQSIIPDGSRVIVKISALNGCIEREQLITVADGKYEFKNLPAVAYSVSIIEHSNSIIYNFFQNKGGQESDLRDIAADTIDFIYFSPPQLELVPFAVNSCGEPLMNQASNYTLRAKVFQDYDGGLCYLDSAEIRVVNDIADESSFDTIMTGGEFIYTFKAGGPNILSPYTKKIEIIATIADGSSTSASQNAVVLGKKANQTTFASASPEIPLIILRDPPGDASFSTLEEGSTTCTSFEIGVSDAREDGAEIGLSLGADLTTSVGLGAEVELEVNATLDFGIAASLSYSSGKNEGIETCLTTTEIFSTSDGDMIVGDQGGDLFVGAAFNFLYGTSYDLLYDEDLCEFNIDTNLTVFPDGFATRYAYTEYHIRNVEIPRLILNDSLKAVQMWHTILDRNDLLKQQAVFSENFSFSAGSVFEKSTTSEITESTSYTFDIEKSDEFTADFGLEVNGQGFSEGLSMTLTQSKSKEASNSNLRARTVGYSLADDDIGDNFTINIKEDKVYGTPVFELVSGKTMCPYETNTLNREEVSISIDRNNAINISENTEAVFNLKVGNLSDEFKVYTVTPVPESNPDAAEIKISGMFGAQDLEIDAGSTLDLTLTVGRGPKPDVYSYQDLGVAIFSACEDDRADFLGIDIDERFYQELAFNVEFIEPCSKVEISSPLQDWVMTPAMNNILNITLSDYDKEDGDLELIRVQYRRIGGDGSWINIEEILKDDLGNLFHILQWNTELLKDDKYEIRAVTQCMEGLNPGISTILRGTLERQPPEIFGVPQPSDGTWDPGDEISITFTEPIDCNKIFQADNLGNNTIGLYDATTDQLVDATISCVGNKIIIVPNINPVFFENRAFRVNVSGKEYDDAKRLENINHVDAAIRDKAGNAVVEDIKWEFFVNQNNLEWVGTNIEEYDEVLKPSTVIRQIRNRGGTIATFRIENIPSWVKVTPTTGTLNPGQLADVIFEFQDDLLIGDYFQTIQLSGSKGDEPLDIMYHVRCPAPDWSFTRQSSFENTMIFTIELDIFGDRSIDESDMIAAYINDEIRGVANIEYVRELDKYIAFLTVYSNTAGDTVRLNVFDGDKCTIYTEVLEDFTFVINGNEGTPLVPTVIHVENVVRRTIPLSRGWNWISVNIDYGDNDLNNVLSTLRRPSGSTIKDDDSFAKHYGGTWVGSLTDLSYDTRYMYKANAADTLVLTGTPYNLAASPISIIKGWNWLGFTSQQGMSPNVAFGSLTPLNGDIIKSQTEFAQYVAGKGWIGNLNFLEPDKGYLLSISNPGTLTYPVLNENSARPVIRDLEKARKRWEMDYNAFEENMNIIAMVRKKNKTILSDGDEVRVLVDGQIRGSAKAEYIEDLDSYMLFITAYGNILGKKMTFEYYCQKDQKVYNIAETEVYYPNTLSGSVTAPLMLSVTTPADVLNEVPDQHVSPSEAFVPTDLEDYIDDETSCAEYKVDYIIPSGSDVAPGLCSRPVYPNSMTVILRPVYGDSAAYNSVNDRIILRNPAGDTVECGTPIEDVYHPGKKIYWLNVGGDAAQYKVSMEFYSDFYKKSYYKDSVFTYVQNGEIGKPDSAMVVDFSPVKATVTGTNLHVSITTPGWIGSHGFVVHSTGCSGGAIGSDTIYYSNDCPVVQLNAMDDVTLSCMTDPGVTLTATASGGTGPYNYSWRSSMGTAIPQNQNVSSSGMYYVTVRDMNGCGRTDSVKVTRAADPLQSVSPRFLSGPAVICASSQNVAYTISGRGMNSIDWSYNGTGVSLTEQSGGMQGVASFAGGASTGYIKATIGNYCSTKSDSLQISYADPFWCGLYSNCKTDVEITSSVLNTNNTPHVFQAEQTMKLLGLVPLKHYEFTAGNSIEFKVNFEVPLGAQIQANIQPCNKE